MEKLKKILMIISLSGVGISALMLIAQVLGLPIFEGWKLRVLLVVATIAVSCGVAINEIYVIKRKRILGYVGLALLGISSLFAIIIFSTNLLTTYSEFNRITGLVALNSILFIIIITQYSKLGRHAIALQIPTYISLVAIDVILSLTIFGVDILGKIITIFIIICIIAVALLIAVSVIGAKMKGTEEPSPIHRDMMEILKHENEVLKKENQELKAEIERLKGEK